MFYDCERQNKNVRFVQQLRRRRRRRRQKKANIGENMKRYIYIKLPPNMNEMTNECVCTAVKRRTVKLMDINCICMIVFGGFSLSFFVGTLNPVWFYASPNTKQIKPDTETKCKQQSCTHQNKCEYTLHTKRTAKSIANAKTKIVRKQQNYLYVSK